MLLVPAQGFVLAGKEHGFEIHPLWVPKLDRITGFHPIFLGASELARFERSQFLGSDGSNYVQGGSRAMFADGARACAMARGAGSVWPPTKLVS